MPAADRAPAVEGELTYVQLDLGGPGIGESAILVGPNGTTILIDTGNDSHDDDVIAALERIHADGSRRVDHVVVTHFHADHAAALPVLLDALDVSSSVVTRGFVETQNANESVVDNARAALDARPGLHAPLCTGAGETCALDDDTRAIDLGAGARLRFVAANARTRTSSFGSLSNDDEDAENARSIVMLLEHGTFRMWLAGDLTGGGSDTDDVEALFADSLREEGVLDDDGVDVIHAGHHGRDTSSSRAFVASLAPRAAIIGVSEAHLGSPHASVLETFAALDVAAFTTRIALGGAAGTALTDARGDVTLRTDGNGFVVEADGEVVSFRATAP